MFYWQLMELVSSPLLEHEKLQGDKICLLQDFMRLVLLVKHLCPLSICSAFIPMILYSPVRTLFSIFTDAWTHQWDHELEFMARMREF